MKSARVHSPGGADAFSLDTVPLPVPDKGQALVRVGYAGVNFIDVYKRSGQYAVHLPSALGEEGSGVVEAVGADVTELNAGDRVAWASHLGSYAEYAVIPAAKLVPVPEGVELRDAAAVMLQGLTAHYLAYSTFPLSRDDRCLIHASAGGVGLLLVQMAKRLGAFVIGTAGSAEKAQLARDAGADEVILYRETEFAGEVKRMTEGSGVNVVYDSVGQSTFLAGLSVLAPRGTMVLFGQSSGAVAPFDPQLLNKFGSLFLTRPKLGDYTATRSELLRRSRDLFDWLVAGQLRVRVDSEYPLGSVGDAHSALEGRRTTGKVLIRVR